jgi:ABC-2 type transport system ATP-binding protein
MIEVEHLSRQFGDVQAVDDVTFGVEAGQIFGFLGPNGAGKSTTINMLCTLLKPSSGGAHIDGKDLVADRDDVRRSIGLVFQDPTLDERLTGWQNLRFNAMLYDVPPGVFEPRARELLEMVELSDKIDRDVKTYSGGMKRRLEIVLGLLHRPKVLFMDEPTVGLDPQTRRHIWEYIVRMRDAEGLTVFLTTHYMDETEICDRIAIIDQGKVVACESPDALKSSMGGDVVTLRTSDDASAAQVLVDHDLPAELTDDGVAVRIANGDHFIPEAVRMLDASGIADLVAVDLRRPTLDDVFIKLTGRAIREESASGTDAMRSAARQHGGGR